MSEQLNKTLHGVDLFGDALRPEAKRSTLHERFGLPPFTVLNTREGPWQERKRAWLGLGIQSELGRGDKAIGYSDNILSGFKASDNLVGRESYKDVDLNDPNVPEYKKRSARKFAKQPDGGTPAGLTFGAVPNYAKINKEKEILAAGGRITSKTRAMNGGPLRPGVCRETMAMGDEWDGGNVWGLTGTSIFDPVLCELCYSWFCPAGGTVLDPFAGGSVRGIVAAHLGRRYFGIDLRAEQIEANKAQGESLCGGVQHKPRWFAGDSTALLDKAGLCDFVFSCPPYADLERYSDDPLDLSTMEYPAFVEAYRTIIAKACSRLLHDRFACFVVGEVRGADGNYYNFVGDTVEAFRAAGLAFYNEAILVNAAGTLPVRIGKQFITSRKMGKTHQNCLVFLKGDARKATDACRQPGEVV